MSSELKTFLKRIKRIGRWIVARFKWAVKKWWPRSREATTQVMFYL